MAVGWAKDGAVNDEIDNKIEEALERARRGMPRGDSLEACEQCGAEIPPKRREAVPGVRLCVACQAEREAG